MGNGQKSFALIIVNIKRTIIENKTIIVNIKDTITEILKENYNLGNDMRESGPSVIKNVI